jgi:L-alanine-DL-glutamate epimerase-like enolase superfamily enzyme
VKITRCETEVLRVPLGQRPPSDSQVQVSEVEFLTVRLDTDEGISGWGFNWNYTKGTRAVKVLIDDAYAPALVGRDPMRHREVCRDLFYATHFIGRVGVAQVALCAVELAMWDIRLKAAGQPLWRYLGPARERVKAYNTDGGWLAWSVDELVRDMTRLVERGFDAVKMKLGRPDPRDDFERVKAVRKALGPKVRLMTDVNTVWDLATATYWGRKLEELDVAWLEEPLHPFDRKGHAELARALDLPIAVGETIYSRWDFREYIESGGVDVVQADVTKLSGIDEWLDVAALARAHNLPVVPHTNVQQKLHVQLAAATPNAPMVEYCYESINDIWEEPVVVRDGHYSLPERPGLGCEIAERVRKECRVA